VSTPDAGWSVAPRLVPKPAEPPTSPVSPSGDSAWPANAPTPSAESRAPAHLTRTHDPRRRRWGAAAWSEPSSSRGTSTIRGVVALSIRNRQQGERALVVDRRRDDRPGPGELLHLVAEFGTRPAGANPFMCYGGDPPRLGRSGGQLPVPDRHLAALRAGPLFGRRPVAELRKGMRHAEKIPRTALMPRTPRR
jgi:hypothetical protein